MELADIPVIKKVSNRHFDICLLQVRDVLKKPDAARDAKSRVAG
jgi:hypothetical protein